VLLQKETDEKHMHKPVYAGPKIEIKIVVFVKILEYDVSILATHRVCDA
jgi:hypothetical protein